MTNPNHTDASRSDDLVARLRQLANNTGKMTWVGSTPMTASDALNQAADRIEQLEREKAVVSDLWEQQKEIALDYLADCNKAADRIEALEAALRDLVEAVHRRTIDLGGYDGRFGLNKSITKARATLGEKQ